MRQCRPNIPIAVVSDKAGVEEMSRGFGFGADAYVTMPAQNGDLVDVINRLCGRTRAPRFTVMLGDLKLVDLPAGETLANCGLDSPRVDRHGLAR